MELSFVAVEVPFGTAVQRTQPGYRLSNGVILLPSEQDGNGCYWGAIGMDGIYLHTGKRYQPTSNGSQTIVSFREAMACTALQPPSHRATA